MQVKVIKNNDEYYAVVSGYYANLHRYDVIKSWDKNSACGEIINHNLLNNPINLIDSPFNMLTFSIPLDPITNPEHYYTILLTDKDGMEYPFHIDINKFYNLKEGEKVYYHNLIDFKLLNNPLHKYDFYIIGNYDDRHKITLVDIESPTRFLFTINEGPKYISEIYYMSIYLNDVEVYRQKTALELNDSIQFALSMEDYGEYAKCVLYPKLPYKILQEVKVFYNDKEIASCKNDKDVIRKLEFFIPTISYFDTYLFKLEYVVKEDTVGDLCSTRTQLLEKGLNNSVIEIYDFKDKYDSETDSLKLFFKNKSSENLEYKILINNKEELFTKNNNFEIVNFSSINNKDQNVNIKIYCNKYNYYVKIFETNVKNYPFLYSSFDFIPKIDYTEAMNSNEMFSTIKWTTPGYECYSKVKLNVKFVDYFFNEYLNPWENPKIFYNNGEYFDTTYSDYSEKFQYDFDEKGEFLEGYCTNASLTFDSSVQEFIFSSDNSITIPLWYRPNNNPYSVTVEIYDKYHKLRGTNTIEFSPKHEQQNIPLSSIRLVRNQEMQFGESGTVGEFYKIDKPTPWDCRSCYHPDNKTFTGIALSDYSNVDSNNISLYYYMRSNLDEPLEIMIRRTSNFIKIEYSIKYKDNYVLEPTTFNMQGNEFDKNKITIPRNILTNEGEYVLNIKTFNATGVSSNNREIKFFVYNSKPETPEIELNKEDYRIEDGNILVTKKYLNIEITNNKRSESYSGWNYKEAHFYFRPIKSVYNSYPDYVIQSDKENGTISFKNNVAMENGEYECKIIAYDNSGNASDPYIFTFTLLSEMVVIPEYLFTNKPYIPMKWKIKKSQDSDGFYYQFKHSKDGIKYEYTTSIKHPSPFYVDSNDSEYEELTLEWLKEDGISDVYKEGFYNLVVYEYSFRHPDGLKDYKFESPTVELNTVSNPSNSITCKEIENKVAIINPKSYDEYAYAKDLNDLIFETIHSEAIIEDKVGQHYKIILIDPSGNEYYNDLPLPTEVGIYTFDKIADKCKVDVQQEGVWELRFITIDKFGNDNAYKGYFSYYITLVKRNPVITSMIPTNNNGLEYFSLNSTNIGYSVYTNCYDDIVNFEQHIDKFKINKFVVNFLSTPLNSQYKITLFKNSNNVINVMDSLTESEKETHIKDGRYLFTISAVDPLNRYSDPLEKVFFIDTEINGTVYFLNPSKFISKTVDIVASVTSDINKVYYKFFNIEDLENYDFSKDNYKLWENKTIQEIQYNSSTFDGFKIEGKTFETDGYKVLAYVIEEISSNISAVRFYKFFLNTSVRLVPIFDFSNKVYFTYGDPSIRISWMSSSDEIVKYYVKLDKIEFDNIGNFEVVKSYNIATASNGLLVPVGPNENFYMDIGEAKELEIVVNDNINNFLVTGQYRLSVRAESIYGTFETNDYFFQIDRNIPDNISDNILDNNITLNSNKISWKFMYNASYYEISYDNINFLKTYNTFFYLDYNKLIKEDDKYYIYLRYRTRSGIYTESEKIQILVDVEKLKTPHVEFFNGQTVVPENNILKWKVTVEDPAKAKYIYYSFDKEKWNTSLIKGRINSITNSEIQLPIPDDTYDIFVMTTTDNPSDNPYCNKSELVHSYVKIFAEDIPKPIFANLIKGKNIVEPTPLKIINKIPDVDYFIYVDGIKVQEGYELSSSTLKRFHIVVKAKKHGIDKIFELIKEDEDYHIVSLTSNQYTIMVKDEKVLCNIDASNNLLEISSMPEKRENEVILYREQNSYDNWNVLRISDKLSMRKQWEFSISTFEVK